MHPNGPTTTAHICPWIRMCLCGMYQSRLLTGSSLNSSCGYYSIYFTLVNHTYICGCGSTPCIQQFIYQKAFWCTEYTLFFGIASIWLVESILWREVYFKFKGLNFDICVLESLLSKLSIIAYHRVCNGATEAKTISKCNWLLCVLTLLP